jgi:hypothetical protein
MNDPSEFWLCACGSYNDIYLHCPVCGKDSPIGCDCGDCFERSLDDDEFLDGWSHYPGELLTEGSE